MVIILFSMFSVFSPYSFRLVFRLSVFWLWIQFHLKRLNDTLKAFDDFKNRQQKSMNVFWCIYILKAYIFWKFIQYTILWSKTHWQRMLTKFPSDKLIVSKNALFLFLLFFFSRELQITTVLLLTEAQVHLSKTVCGIFPLQFRLVFIKLYIFIQKRAQTLWL